MRRSTICGRFSPGRVDDRLGFRVPMMMDDNSGDVGAATGGAGDWQARLLGEVLKPAAKQGPPWSDEELADVLRHQLDAPLLFDLGRVEQAQLQQLHKLVVGASQPPIVSFRDLLRHLAPPLELLHATKDFAKASSCDLESPVPTPVAMALYYAAIATALLRHGARLTTMDDASLLKGLAWVVAQPWVDPEIRLLLVDAQTRVAPCNAMPSP
jgi:hypothetical protein